MKKEGAPKSVKYDAKTEALIKKMGGRSKVVVLDKGPFPEPQVLSKRYWNKKPRRKGTGGFGDPIVGFGDPSMVGH
jgi:hypothetical protein